MKLQIWRKMLNLERVGLVLCFVIPALWQGLHGQANTLFQNRETAVALLGGAMTVRLNFGRHWFPFDKMGLKQFS
jgi:hypothetical protein